VTYRIVLTAPAREPLRAIRDRRILRQLGRRIDSLAESPELQGKPLRDELAGFRVVRAVGQKYRIIYHVERGIVTVLVVALGRRRSKSKEDIYELTRKLLRLGLIDMPK
jgi:mRNA interferase RelE/StbE